MTTFIDAVLVGLLHVISLVASVADRDDKCAIITHRRRVAYPQHR